jgi:hypothetical protein
MFRHHHKCVGSKPIAQPRVFQSSHNHVPNLTGMELGEAVITGKGNEMRLPCRPRYAPWRHLAC